MKEEEREDPAVGAGGAVASEDALDALDASPENRRRSAVVLGTIGILFLLAIVMIVSVPPLSGQASKGADSHYHELSDVSLEDGGSGGHVLSYARVTAPIFYGIEVDQETRYAGGSVSRVSFRGDLELSRPELRHFEDEVTLKFSKIDVRVYDGDREVGLSDAGRMLEGIALYTRLTGNGGLLNVYPEAKINPQVGRVLYMLSDALRGMWMPLAEGAIGAGGRYRVSDKGEGARRSILVRAKSVSEDAGEFETDIEVLSGDERVGHGRGAFGVKGGVLESASYEIERDGAFYESGAISQTLKVRGSRSER